MDSGNRHNFQNHKSLACLKLFSKINKAVGLHCKCQNSLVPNADFVHSIVKGIESIPTTSFS